MEHQYHICVDSLGAAASVCQQSGSAIIISPVFFPSPLCEVVVLGHRRLYPFLFHSLLLTCGLVVLAICLPWHLLDDHRPLARGLVRFLGMHSSGSGPAGMRASHPIGCAVWVLVARQEAESSTHPRGVV